MKKKFYKRKEVWIVIACVLVLVIAIIGGRIFKQNHRKPVSTSLDEHATKVDLIGDEYKDYIAQNAIVQSDVTYGTAKNYKGEMESLKLDVYSPDQNTYTQNAAELAAQKKRPAIILIHGGSLTHGDKASSGVLKSMSNDYARMGYVVFNVNYRLGTEASAEVIDNALKDIATAFSWIQSQSDVYGIDKDTIFIGGSSAGAVLSVDLVYSNLSRYEFNRSSVAGVIDLSGMRLQMGRAEEGNPDCLIIHGNKDATDPYSESEMLKAALDKVNVLCELYTLEGMGHDISIRYNEVRNKVAMFLYKKLTGVDTTIEIVSDKDPEYEKVVQRVEKNPGYAVKELPVVLDGQLDEWKDCESISLTQLKDAGNAVPTKDDFSGDVMVAWNRSTPTIVYLAATITDDVIKSDNASDGKWYNNDCFEIAFDLSSNNVTEQSIKWVIGANGTDFNVMADQNNTNVAMTTNGNTTTYEIAIDLSKIDNKILNNYAMTTISPENNIGFSIAYDDADQKVREHQIGWIAGKMSDRLAMGTLYFE